jgi:hypothetical protein
MLGSLFIVVVLFLPQGVVGIPKLIKDAVQRRRSPLDDATRPSPGALAQPPVTPAPDGVPSAVSSPTSEP